VDRLDLRSSSLTLSVAGGAEARGGAVMRVRRQGSSGDHRLLARDGRGDLGRCADAAHAAALHVAASRGGGGAPTTIRSY
jgi:hypothetical protein